MASQAATVQPGATARAKSGARILDRLAVALLLAVAAIAALSFRDYGLGWDDFTHAQYGDMLLALYGSGFTDTRALSFVNLYLYGGGFDMAAALAAKVLPFDLFDTRRLIGAAVGIIGLLATWRLARRIGGPLAGLIALALLATCPLYYGHMFINPKDMPFAAMMAVLLLGLVRAFDRYPRPNAATVALVGIGFGLSFGSRILGGLAGLYALAALALIVGSEWRATGMRAAVERLGRFVLALLPALLIAIVLMAVVWPWSVLDPRNIFRAAGYFSEFFEKPWKEQFGAALIEVTEMPRSYVPTLMALQLPELMFALACGGAIGALAATARRDISVERRATLMLVALAAIVPVAVAVLERPGMYNGIRHFVFALPPVAALGGLAGAWCIERLRHVGRAAVIAAVAVLLAGLAIPVIAMVRLHPYQYTHFNLLAGGVKGADDRYMLDYWGLSFRQASQALRAVLAARNEAPPAGRPWKIAVCGPHPPAQVALGALFEPTWDPKGADFAMMLGEFYCATLDAPVLAEIVRDGVVYARVYDTRGRNIPSLFTIPPVERDKE
jgi:4-amino-4-deoxy-L-arabinose transferase-like glycosyltransferase